MKKLVALLALSLSSCASVAPMSYQEQCAVKGMKLHGVSESNGTGFATAYNWQTGQSATATSRMYGEAVSCVIPETEREECEVSNWQQIAMPKARYNSDFQSKWVLNGVGYYLFIVPGIVMKVVYDGQLRDAMNESSAAAAIAEKCGPRTPASKTDI